MKTPLTLILACLFSGCLCCGTGLDGVVSPETTESEACEAPYIQVGSECCLDADGNNICDGDEATDETQPPEETTSPQETPQPEETALTGVEATVTTLEPVQTTMAPAATATIAPAAAPSCSDGIQNQGEEYPDCGGPCALCQMLALNSGWKKYGATGYQFRFDGREGADAALKYNIEIKTPDGLLDRRPISTGESFVDYLRFKAVNYGEDEPRIYVRVNTEDLARIPANASLITIGGQSCAQSTDGLCERRIGQYKLHLISRGGSGEPARLWLTGPDGVPVKIDVDESKYTYSGDTLLVIGGFFDKNHFIQGGYNLFYAYLR